MHLFEYINVYKRHLACKKKKKKKVRNIQSIMHVTMKESIYLDFISFQYMYSEEFDFA